MGQTQRLPLKINFANERRKILRDAENAFALTIANYPYVITHDLSRADGKWTDEISAFVKEREAWLAANCLKHSYIAFPNGAVGKYKGAWQKVFFRRAQDAMMYKLIWYE
jgi:hypothetical protein